MKLDIWKQRVKDAEVLEHQCEVEFELALTDLSIPIRSVLELYAKKIAACAFACEVRNRYVRLNLDIQGDPYPDPQM